MYDIGTESLNNSAWKTWLSRCHLTFLTDKVIMAAGKSWAASEKFYGRNSNYAQHSLGVHSYVFYKNFTENHPKNHGLSCLTLPESGYLLLKIRFFNIRFIHCTKAISKTNPNRILTYHLYFIFGVLFALFGALSTELWRLFGK